MGREREAPPVLWAQKKHFAQNHPHTSRNKKGKSPGVFWNTRSERGRICRKAPILPRRGVLSL